MGAVLQSVKHHQCYTISFYTFTIVVEYHKELSMWADYFICILFSNYLNGWLNRKLERVAHFEECQTYFHS